ncbi:hypothetical protein K2173_008084 [Erythroxylum novogranatense]|uniref:Uncharacterized protein n=1 Tax=Erythroxylum novogranatense TaxID=1862640 RepID=A0AAV8S969_9ROSI|nr:hypothetical protein K2173_008084 [Erythroxylum novogranatense]
MLMILVAVAKGRPLNKEEHAVVLERSLLTNFEINPSVSAVSVGVLTDNKVEANVNPSVSIGIKVYIFMSEGRNKSEKIKDPSLTREKQQTKLESIKFSFSYSIGEWNLNFSCQTIILNIDKLFKFQRMIV